MTARDPSGERLHKWQHSVFPDLPDEITRIHQRRTIGRQEWAYIGARTALQAAEDWASDWHALMDWQRLYERWGPALGPRERDKDKPPAWAVAAMRAGE